MFQLTDQEHKDLKSQFATSSWGGRRCAASAFTEQDVAMLSLGSYGPRAVAVSIDRISNEEPVRLKGTDHKDRKAV
jgi:hypothetical protein